MADTTRIANNAASAEADALARLLDNGYLRIYDSTGGTGQPATVDTAIGSQARQSAKGRGTVNDDDLVVLAA